jgi:hypothetical protein
LTAVVAAAAAIMLVISAGSYFAFGLAEVRTLLLSKIRARFLPEAPS